MVKNSLQEQLLLDFVLKSVQVKLIINVFELNESIRRIKKVSIEEINPKQILTVSETARLLKCSNKTIYRLIEKGNLKAGNLSDRMTRIKRSEIDSILDAQKDDELDNVDLSKY